MARDPKVNVEAEEAWDLETPVAHQTPRRPRAVVSVPLRPDEFSAISEAASSVGEKLSVFMRSAALDRTRQVSEAHISVFVTHSSSQQLLSTGDPQVETESPSLEFIAR